MPHASSGVIAQKGTKGLLLWIQAKMPNFYDQLSPMLLSAVNNTPLGRLGCPRVNALHGVYMGNFRDRHNTLVAMGTLGDTGTTGDAFYAPATGTAVNEPVTLESWNVASAATTPTDLTTDFNSGNSTNSTASSNASAAQSANQTSMSPSTASLITAAANGVVAGTLAYGEVQANNTLLKANIARANAGLAPLGSTGAVSSLLGSGSTPLLIIGGVLAAFLLMGGKKSSSVSS
jgi:hypothetical protein